MLHPWTIALTALVGAGQVQEAPRTYVRSGRDANVVAAPYKQSAQRVSIRFNQASVGEVLEWLSQNGVNFVAADSEIDRAAKITLNVKDRPIDEVMDALAAALGGHWGRRGEMRVFRKGAGEGFYTPGAPGAIFKMSPEVMPAFPHGDMKVFTPRIEAMPALPQGDMKVFTPEMKLKMEGDLKRSLEGLKDLKVLPKVEALRAMEAERGVRARIERLQTKPHGRMSPEERRKVKVDIERAMREAKEAMAEARKNMTPEEREKIERALEEAHKAIEQSHRNMEHGLIPMPDVETNVVPGDRAIYKVRPEGEGGRMFRVLPKIQGGRAGTLPRIRESLTLGREPMLRTGDLDRLIDGLTPAQRELHDRQGFLWARDLTREQRRMLGITDRGGSWTISYKKDRRSITIKSDN